MFIFCIYLCSREYLNRKHWSSCINCLLISLYIEYNNYNSNSRKSLKQYVSTYVGHRQVFPWRNNVRFIYVQYVHGRSLSAWRVCWNVIRVQRVWGLVACILALCKYCLENRVVDNGVVVLSAQVLYVEYFYGVQVFSLCVWYAIRPVCFLLCASLQTLNVKWCTVFASTLPNSVAMPQETSYSITSKIQLIMLGKYLSFIVLMMRSTAPCGEY